MSLRYKGAVISATPPTTTGGESGVASGSWTLEQQFQAQGAGNWPIPFVAKYIEDVFSTYLYTGNGSTQTITNGIDLSGQGGLVWVKMRSNGSATGNVLFDTARGASQKLETNTAGASSNWTPYGVSAFGSTGFTVADDGAGNYITNNSGVNYASWTFREQPKFFDVVTYTGNGTNGRTVAHSLGSTPGCIIVKRTDASNGWAVYHRAMNASPQDYMMRLNATDAAFTTSPSRWNNTLPTSTDFTLSGNDEVNGSGATYVAYLFAHNAGGFGLTGTDNVISCGTFSGNTTVTLGYEPQWIMLKRTDAVGNWDMHDVMRGWPVSGDAARLRANLSDAESQTSQIYPNATGFSTLIGAGNYIYIAIRRGPMKVPTSGTSVFGPTVQTAAINSTTPVVMTPEASDMWMDAARTSGIMYSFPRLTGFQYLVTSSTDAEQPYTWTNKTQSDLLPNFSNWFSAGTSQVNYFFKRAPSFFDVVCYTGTGSVTTFSHNLGVVPELMIVRRRSAGGAWMVNSQYLAADARLELQSTSAVKAPPEYGDVWNNTRPTSTVFTVSTDSDVNASGGTYVNYLFATCAGVSKVGSYTGTGTTLQVNCGFTGGARFVLIKRTDSTGDWYVWDSARGIVSGNDPYLLLNSAVAEVTNTDYVDTYSAGFEITSTAPAAINASGGTFIFLAIA